MSTIKKQNREFLETLKSNYKRRIEEADAFSRNFSKASADFRSEYLAGLSDLIQYYVDLQKKLTEEYPTWYDTDLMSKQSRMITETWINTLHNMGSLYSVFLDFGTKNTRIFKQGVMQMMQLAEMYHDMSEMPTIQRNTLIEIIKQVKEHNDNFVQKQLPKKRNLIYKGIEKKQVIAKEVL